VFPEIFGRRECTIAASGRDAPEESLFSSLVTLQVQIEMLNGTFDDAAAQVALGTLAVRVALVILQIDPKFARVRAVRHVAGKWPLQRVARFMKF
jgi:hypothetical protein